LSEDALIARIARAARQWNSREHALRASIGDDAALWRPRSGRELVLTCDWFLQDSHFLLGKHPPDAVGWKCLARAVSDIAAMGGTPRCFLMGLALPEAQTGRWLDEFLRGLGRASRAFHCALAGGDTTRKDRVSIHITVIGEVARGRALLRSGARAGDAIFVSGRLGEAELGLRLLRDGAHTSTPAMQKHLYPQPRLALGAWLAKNSLATAAMDISDGLSSDLSRLCSASSVGGRIEMARLPGPTASQALRAGISRSEAASLALEGGDDYELLFTAKPANWGRIPRSWHGLRSTQIGVITKNKSVRCAWPNGVERPLVPRGWDSFRKQD
jgi:thiamine-monophosphate kinase